MRWAATEWPTSPWRTIERVVIDDLVGRHTAAAGRSLSTRFHVMESGWLPRMQDCRLYAYRLPDHGRQTDQCQKRV
jgi:hypothetical protein